MRYLYFLFFVIFSFHSYLVFAQNHSPLDPSQGCVVKTGYTANMNIQAQRNTLTTYTNTCMSRTDVNLVSQISYTGSNGNPVKSIECYACAIPCLPPDEHDPATKTCLPPDTPPSQTECPDGDCPPEEPPCPSGFPRVDGQCPICVGGYNEDGTCADDESGSSSSASSPPSSSPSSTPSSESPPPENPGGGDDDGSSSSTGGGDDGNGSPGTGGGTPGGGDGGNTGGGSASSASSTAGGAGGSSGSNNSWTPHAGFGNWIPISENSPCPNKYQDNTGQWWCAGGGGSGEIPGAGQCDPTSPNYMACITQDSNSGASSSACSPSSPDYLECSGKLESAQGEITGYADSFIETIDEKTEEYKNALTEDLDNFSNEGVSFKDEPGILRSALTSLLPVSTSCNPPDIRWNGRNYELSCTYFDAFKQAVGWFLAILLAWNIYQLAIRPVDR